MNGLLSGGTDAVGSALIAIGALGTASYGLVDVTKAFWGGPSLAGFSQIRRAVMPFAAALTTGAGPHWQQVLLSHWINGSALDDQKAKAKALIRLGLTAANAKTMAGSLDGRIDANALETAVTKTNNGTPLTPTDLNALGRFDAIVSAALDAGYERADQNYRSVARMVACVIAVILAIIAGALIDANLNAGKIDWGVFVWKGDLLTAVLVGLVSTPLAPVAKDLASALNTAASAFKAAKG